MRTGLYIMVTVCMLMLAACKGKDHEGGEPADGGLPAMIIQIQKCSRLYTSEYKIHKIVTHQDELSLSGSVMKQDFKVSIPVGKRRIAIPMDATLKAYVDFSGFSEKNVRKTGKKIVVTLPDPKLMMTSTKINHDEVKKYVPLTRGNFSDEEMTSYERQGRQQIVNDIPKMGIIENARKNAATTIIPIIRQMGYEEEDITVTFRKDFSVKNLTIEKG